MATFWAPERPGRAARRRRWRWRPGRLALAALAACLPLALAWGVIGALAPVRDALAAVAPSAAGSLPYRAEGRFVRVLAGVVLVAPVPGRLVRVAADGAAVAAGTVLARIVPPGGGAAAVAALGRFDAANGPEIARLQAAGTGLSPAGTARLRRLQAERTALIARLAAALALTPATPVIAADPGRVHWAVAAGAGAGGWTPRRLATARAAPAPATGAVVATGQRLGTLTPFASARWGVVGLRPAPPAGASVRLQPGGLHLRVAGVTGPIVWLVGPDPAGAAAGRGRAIVTWGRAQGTLVPAAAVIRRGGSAWVLVERGGRLRWVSVQVLTGDGNRMAVAGLAAGAAVSRRPWLGVLWATRQ